MYQLKITREGSLLTRLVTQAITADEVNSILALLKAPDLTYREVLEFLASRNYNSEDYVVEGAGESVEAFRG